MAFVLGSATKLLDISMIITKLLMKILLKSFLLPKQDLIHLF